MDTETTDEPATIPEASRRAAGRWPDADALVEGTRRWSFRDYRDDADAIARGLIARGIQPGDRVAIWAPNSAEFAIGAMAVYSTGAALVPLNSRYTPREAGDLIGRAGARAVLAFSEFLGRPYLGALLDNSLIDPSVTPISLRGEAPDRAISLDQLRTEGDAIPQERVLSLESALTADDISDVIFTSGTTGTPKGAMLTHGASTRGYVEFSRSQGLMPGDRIVGIPPFFHCFGLKAVVLAAVLSGAAVLPVGKFDVLSCAELVRREMATVLPGPAPIFIDLTNAVERGELKASMFASLRLLAPGAMGVAPHQLRRMQEVLQVRHLARGYGLTETTAVGTRAYWNDDFETVSETAGYPSPGVELIVAGSDRRPCPTDEAGEILIRGYPVMAGYLDDPEATAEAIEPDGWLHTGDIGFLDGKGRLHITDRKKDMFLVGGFNTYPAEIEHVLSKHPDVHEIAVIGVPDERLGEVGKAFVIPNAGHDLDEETLRAYARELLANYKVPRYWQIVEDLPRNANGKIQKFLLRAEKPTPGPIASDK